MILVILIGGFFCWFSASEGYWTAFWIVLAITILLIGHILLERAEWRAHLHRVNYWSHSGKDRAKMHHEWEREARREEEAEREKQRLKEAERRERQLEREEKSRTECHPLTEAEAENNRLRMQKKYESHPIQIREDPPRIKSETIWAKPIVISKEHEEKLKAYKEKIKRREEEKLAAQKAQEERLAAERARQDLEREIRYAELRERLQKSRENQNMGGMAKPASFVPRSESLMTDLFETHNPVGGPYDTKK